jgi:PadR family transcriptional regulator PadR
MSRNCCRHKNSGQPCSCEMGNFYRFIEPIILLSLMRLGPSHGYQIAREARKLAVTHAGLDPASVYRTLKRLAANGYVQSEWRISDSGPAKHQYSLTLSGENHLRQWISVLNDFVALVNSLVKQCQAIFAGSETPDISPK